MRVYVVGGPGSGKTTLATALASRTGVPVHELDDVWSDGGTAPIQQRLLATATAVSGRAEWICEGIYDVTAAPLFDAADVVVWLDPPWPVAVRRILSRHAGASLRRRNRYKGLGLLARFVRSAVTGYYRGVASDDGNTRANAAAMLAPLHDKVVHVTGAPSRARVRDAAVAAVRTGLLT